MAVSCSWTRWTETEHVPEGHNQMMRELRLAGLTVGVPQGGTRTSARYKASLWKRPDTDESVTLCNLPARAQARRGRHHEKEKELTPPQVRRGSPSGAMGGFALRFCTSLLNSCTLSASKQCVLMEECLKCTQRDVPCVPRLI